LSLLGRLARLISACFGLPSLKPRALADGERLACALADHMSLVRRAREVSAGSPWHVGNGEIDQDSLLAE
jgi:hypothetical protein